MKIGQSPNAQSVFDGQGQGRKTTLSENFFEVIRRFELPQSSLDLNFPKQKPR